MGRRFRWIGLGLALCLGCKSSDAGPGPAAAGTSGGAGTIAAGASGTGPGTAGSGTSGAAVVNGASGSAAAGTAAGSGASPGPASFSRVWTEVLMLKGCAGEYCHGAMTGNLGLHDKAQAYMNLVGVTAAGPKCGTSGELRVKPFDPDASLLMDKISHAMPSCGDAMPVGVKFPPNCLSNSPAVCTTDAELTLVRDWIAAGAKND